MLLLLLSQVPACRRAHKQANELRGAHVQAHELAERDLTEYGKLLSAKNVPSEETADGTPIHIDDLLADMHSNASQQV